MLSQSSEHGGNNQVQIPIEIFLGGFGVGSLKFGYEVFREFPEKALVHFLDEAGGFGKTTGDKLGQIFSCGGAFRNFMTNRQDQGSEDLARSQGPVPGKIS